jgi:folate-dependent phosphoribosylglycinamide formyltransferase PurN
MTILISSSATNLQALINACSSIQLPNTYIARVISNRKEAFGLKRAENSGIPTSYHNVLAYKSALNIPKGQHLGLEMQETQQTPQPEPQPEPHTMRT